MGPPSRAVQSASGRSTSPVLGFGTNSVDFRGMRAPDRATVATSTGEGGPPYPGPGPEPWWWKGCGPYVRELYAKARGLNTRRRLGVAGGDRERYPLYVRFGDLPEGGVSTTGKREALREGDYFAAFFASDDFEEGVSCFRARKAEDGFYECDLSPSLWLRVMFSLVRREGRPAFELFGEEVGTGQDGEPVLRVERAEPIPKNAVRGGR